MVVVLLMILAGGVATESPNQLYRKGEGEEVEEKKKGGKEETDGKEDDEEKDREEWERWREVEGGGEEVEP